MPPREGGVLLFWATLFVFALVAILGVRYHEPWRDEADAWLMARDNSVGSLLKVLRYAGTPSLWYLIQMPLAHAGLPYQTQAILNLLIVIAAAAVLLRWSPFSRITKILILFSYYVAFEYTVIARSYGLAMLLLFAAAAVHGRRFEHPLAFGLLVALLMNTCVQGFLVGLGLGLLFLYDAATLRRLAPANVAALVILAAGAALLAMQVVPSAGAEKTAWFDAYKGEALALLVQNAIIPARRLMNARLMPWCGVLNALAVVGAASVVVRRPRLLLLLAFVLVSLCGLMVLVHYGGIRHAGFVLPALVLVVWIGEREAAGEHAGNGGRAGRSSSIPAAAGRIALNVALVGSCMVTASTYVKECRFAFSAAKEMAGYIEQAGLTNRTVAAFPDPVACAVLPYLPQRQFWYAGTRRFGSHMLWDADFYRNRMIPQDEALARIEAAFPAATNVLVLLNAPAADAAQRGWRLLYQTTGTVFTAVDEQYWLYERSGQPASPAHQGEAR